MVPYIYIYIYIYNKIQLEFFCIFILLVSWKWDKHDQSSVNVTEDWQIEYINVSIGKLQYYIRIICQT